MTAVIHSRGVRRQFGHKVALDSLDLSLDTGEIVGFVGPNGAGKSTFLRLLVGLFRRNSGELEVLGRDPDRGALEIRRRASYLPGETSVYHYMTGAEFLSFAVGFHPQRQDLPAVAAELFELPLERKVREYSAGMKQKLALLATLRPDVELYILDEPDRALDATARLQLRELLHELRSRGKSVLLSSHHLAEIDALADRTVFLFDGRDVPTDRVEHARRVLRREVRLRLDGDVEIPSGVESSERQADGSLRVRTADDPVQWLGRLPAGCVISAEIGATRVEDLYRVLEEELHAHSEAGAR
jgi:ABC-2 type transport system ATP-binding protein